MSNAPRDLIPTHSRRCWVGRITGPDPKYRLGREFLKKAPHSWTTEGGGSDSTFGVRVPGPGVYQWQTYPYGGTIVKSIEIWNGVSWSEFDSDPVDLVKRIQRANPGKTWKTIVQTLIDHAPNRDTDGCTFCPADLEHFTPDGWGVCETHLAWIPADQAAPLPDLPVPTV